MTEIAALPERLSAYRSILKTNPDLTAEERERLFALAVWPEDHHPRPVLTWAHMQRCSDKDCRICRDGVLEDDIAA